jgi:hypothetical protein
MTQTRLQKLKAQADAAKARLQQEMAREQQRERDRETRRRVLAGELVLKQCANDPVLAEGFRKHLDRFLTRDNDRALFGFAPLPLQPNGTPPLNGDVSGNGAAH